MFFCGTCVAGYKHSADNTYVITDDANSLIIESGVFDHLYVTRSVEDALRTGEMWAYENGTWTSMNPEPETISNQKIDEIFNS